MKLAILYICTGKYNIFFQDFYESCEKYLLNGEAQKDYYVFTDDLNIPSSNNVHLIFKKCEGFPADSLFRFEMFTSIKERLIVYDYIYFFNSNAKFLQPVGKEILPIFPITLVGAEWPTKRKPFKHPAFYPYERNKKSTAYISSHEKKPYIYYMGGINGGCAKDYIEMIESLAKNIRTDYNNGIVAKVHDESHINKYFRSHKCKILPPEYCIPEEFILPTMKPKIIFRNKVALNNYFNKGRKNNLKTKIIHIMQKINSIINWYI